MKYLFFDTETAGFNGPILQLAWILTDEDGDVLESSNELLRHSIEFEINEKALEIHGITKEMCIEKGKLAQEQLRILLEKMADADRVVAHNLGFDWDMLSKDKIRYAMRAEMPSHQKAFCTMKTTTDVCKLPNVNGRGGYKWPKLQELHVHLFGDEFDGAHDALADVRATSRCFFELKRLGIVAV